MYDVIGAQRYQHGHSPHHHTGYPLACTPSTGLSFNDAKAWLEEESFGVKRKYLALGALALGVGYYGYTKGWF